MIQLGLTYTGADNLMTSSPPPRYATSVATDAGLRRKNEDAYICEPDCGIFAVIDGMGGGPHGERVAAIARDVILARLRRPDVAPDRRVREAIALANRAIVDETAQNSAMKGAGCVVTVAIVENGTVTLGHVGDSKCCVMSSGSLRQVTDDHTPVAEWLRRGLINETEARHHPHRNRVSRYLGEHARDPDDDTFIAQYTFTFEGDMTVVLATDGVFERLNLIAIESCINKKHGVWDCLAAELVAAALSRGTTDNLTVILIRNQHAGAMPNFALLDGGQASRTWRSRAALALWAVVLLVWFVFLPIRLHP